MAEEVEIKVSESAPTPSPSLLEGLRRLLLASIGVIAMTYDEAEAFVNKLVERGELAQKDAERVLHEVQGRLRQRRPQFRQAEGRVESGVEQVLNRLNIPSKRDIDDLSYKIAQLAARVEELRKTQQNQP